MQGLVGSIIDCIMGFLVSLIHLVSSLLTGMKTKCTKSR